MSVATKARPAPPKPKARKDDPINSAYEDEAKALLKLAMSQQGVGIDQLAERLNKMGVEISAGGLANKISRGGFSSAFLMQCMKVLEVDLKKAVKS